MTCMTSLPSSCLLRKRVKTKLASGNRCFFFFFFFYQNALRSSCLFSELTVQTASPCPLRSPWQSSCPPPPGAYILKRVWPGRPKGPLNPEDRARPGALSLCSAWSSLHGKVGIVLAGLPEGWCSLSADSALPFPKWPPLGC